MKRLKRSAGFTAACRTELAPDSVGGWAGIHYRFRKIAEINGITDKSDRSINESHLCAAGMKTRRPLNNVIG